MGRKRSRAAVDSRMKKRIRVPAKKQNETDLDYISEHDYVRIGDFLYVRPYVFEFRTNFKPRWRHQTIHDVFCQEFKHTDSEYWTKEISEGRVLVDGKAIYKGTLWDDGMEVVHVVHRHESAVLSTPIKIACNEEGYLVVSKPPSLPIHPCGTYRRNSLQFILKAFYNTGKLLAVHRLDKETSGLVILAKNSSFAAQFSAEIKEHKFRKTYLAEVHGFFPLSISECVEPLAWNKREMKGSVSSEGLEAKTSFKRISVNAKTNTSIVECKPLTGRTHQIRIHLTYLGHAIVNDPLYGTHPARATTTLVSQVASDPQKVSLNDPGFRDESQSRDLRRTYLATEWSKRSLEQNGKHLSCAEEGHVLSCSNCPQVTNAKNVEVQQMFIHLHALRYESENWSFEVAPPLWISKDKKESVTENSDTMGIRQSCDVC